MALNLATVVIDYLKDRPEEKFSARQIAEWVFVTYPDECQEKRANSRGDYIKSDADLVQQLCRSKQVMGGRRAGPGAEGLCSG